MNDRIRAALAEFVADIESVRADFVAGLLDLMADEYLEAEFNDDFTALEPGDLVVTDEADLTELVGDFDWRWKWALRRLREALERRPSFSGCGGE